MGSEFPQRFNKLFEVISDEAFMGFVTFDGEKCVYMNRLARELLELKTENDCSQVTLDSLCIKEERGDYRPFSKDLLVNEGLYQDVVIRKQNGFSFISNMGVKRVDIDNIQYLLLMFQDITLQKKLQRDVIAKQAEIQASFEEIMRQNRQLKELDLAKNRFIALTTHELRTPLAAMVSSAEILNLGMYESDKQLKEFVDIIYDQGMHLQELVNDILDFAKIQAGKMDFFVEHQEVNSLVESLVENFDSMAESSQVELKFTEPQASVLAYFDEIRFRQVLSNIINNAIKYNVRGGLVKIWIEDSDSMVKIHCQDTGKGIAEDEQLKVFDEFETLGKVALHHRGTGLGMPISKRLMEGMGGTINLSSEPGKGSTFWVEIPKTKVLDDSLYRTRPDNAGDLVA